MAQNFVKKYEKQHLDLNYFCDVDEYQNFKCIKIPKNAGAEKIYLAVFNFFETIKPHLTENRIHKKVVQYLRMNQKKVAEILDENLDEKKLDELFAQVKQKKLSEKIAEILQKNLGEKINFTIDFKNKKIKIFAKKIFDQQINFLVKKLKKIVFNFEIWFLF